MSGKNVVESFWSRPLEVQRMDPKAKQAQQAAAKQAQQQQKFQELVQR
jgi:hypothetical protein